MKHKKQLKELTIKDNFMFAAVMMEEENCREFLEIALGFSIEMFTPVMRIILVTTLRCRWVEKQR